MIEWPSELPNHALRNGYSVKPRSNVIAHQTQTGPGTRRRRQSSNIYDAPVPIYLESEEQRHAFQRFYEDATQSGALPFIWPELDRFIGPRYYKYWFDKDNPFQLAPMGVEFSSQINLVAWPDAQPVNIIEDGTLKLGTLTQSSIDYYDANGDLQTAPEDTEVVEYNPVDGSIRGLPLGADGQIAVNITAGESATLKYSEEPATVDDRTVYALSDGTAANRIALLVEGGNYVFRVTVGGTDVANLDTGVSAERYKRKEIDASYAVDAFYAAASGGDTVSDTSGSVPNLTTWTIGDPGNHDRQCWIMGYSYVPRALREFNPIQAYGPGYLELAGDAVKHPLVQVTRNTETTYLDANGVRQTAAIDEPVFEYRPESGEMWLRKEQLATNYFLDSDNPATQSISLGTGTYTAWIEGSGSLDIAGQGTATEGDHVTFTLGSSGSVTCTVSGSVDIAQVENSAAPTSYIPTTDSARTRAANDIRVTDLNLLNGFLEGTFIVVFETQSYGGDLYPRVLSAGAEFATLNVNNNSIVSNIGGAPLNTAITGNLKAPIKFGITWEGTYRAQSANGSVPQSRDWERIPQRDLLIGDNGRKWSGWIKLRFIPRRVPDSELQQLTQPD